MVDLSKNKLTSLPENMAVFSLLEQLNLSYNQITSLPPAVSTLKYNLYRDRVIFSSALHIVADVLRLSVNPFTRVFLFSTSPYIRRRLTLLDVSNNVLAEIPSEIGNMNLEHFSLAYNRLRRLPTTMGYAAICTVL